MIAGREGMMGMGAAVVGGEECSSWWTTNARTKPTIHLITRRLALISS